MKFPNFRKFHLERAAVSEDANNDVRVYTKYDWWVLLLNFIWADQCWWRMTVTFYVGDKFETVGDTMTNKS